MVIRSLRVDKLAHLSRKRETVNSGTANESPFFKHTKQGASGMRNIPFEKVSPPPKQPCLLEKSYFRTIVPVIPAYILPSYI